MLEKNTSGVYARDSKGNLLFKSATDNKGGIRVTNAKGELVKYYSPEEVANLNAQ
jgi:hypothetical protein